MRSRLRSHRRLTIAICATLPLTVAAVLSTGCGSVTDSPTATGSTATAPAHRGPVCLTTEFFPISHEERLWRLPLVRELGRQAVLIAARDGLGLPTRDQTLAESFPEKAEDRLGPFALKVRGYQAGNGNLSLLSTSTGDASGRAPAELGHYEFNFQSDTYNIYTALAISLGAASRTELVDMLRQAGCTGQAVKYDPDGPLPDDVEPLLAEMGFVAQYAALRRIHDAIARQGESPARLGGLVRGYANLAMLTRHHWNSANVVFAARALLYAERMLALRGNTRLALQHRAYARALVGLHGIALQDLERLPAEVPPADDAQSAPSWTKVIEPFCRFDDETLLKLAKEPSLAQLVPQLAFEIKACYGDSRWTPEFGRLAAKQCPESFGIYAEMADKAPMLIQREAVTISMDVFGRQLPGSVARIADLPPSAAELVRDLARPGNSVSQTIEEQTESAALSPLPMKLAEALRAAESVSQGAGEPSWDMLAQLIADEQFIQLANCLEVSLIAVESSKQGLVDRMGPLVAGHPYAPYILSFAIDGSRQPAELAQLLGQITVKDPRGRMQPLFDIYRDATDASGTTYAALSAEALWQRDYHLPALIESLGNVYESWWKSPQLVAAFQRLIVDLQAISPHAPNILRLKISTTVDPSAEQLAEWEQRAKADPVALSQIARLYANHGKLDVAIRCYERSYDLSPNHDTTISLATAYRDNGQPDKWRPTLDRYLKVDDYALGHSIIERHIALDHLERCEWTEAEPHALASARTWSTMGLVTASRVYEGMGRWQESERWIREATLNYPTYNGMEWYLWCRRNGRGDRQQARLHADDFLQHSWLPRQESGVDYPFLNDMIDERYEDALAHIGRTPRCVDDLYWQIQVALLAQQLGRDEVSEQAMTKALQLVDQQPREVRPQLHSMVAILAAGRNESAFTEAQLAEADELLDRFSYAIRCNFAYYLAEFLVLQGDEKRAESYWQKALETGQFDNRNATLAGWRLAQQHGTSRADEVKPADAQSAPGTATDGL